MNYQEYMEKTYAAWLGKWIGIRLGAPVEGWTAEEIRRIYGSVKGYLVDYGTFAADDDANGPMFFVRALEKHCSEEIQAEEMGENVLNWLCDGHGFFWWGGEGIATEHTAYNNLKKGIAAPQSGSAALNGTALAEQIGGQIFSDCWGYVACGNPQRAKNLAAKMSSVTHDKDGIQGGIFVAVSIALAYQMNDARTIVEQALTFLDPQSSYVKLCRSVIEQIRAAPDDPQRVLSWIFHKHGYDRYPGVCHILPNTAIMIWALFYGNNDFDRTMTMLCEAGWDTDCTLGNVGSILGAMLGLAGIDEKWSRPMEDVALFSSCMGSKNIDTISRTARVFAELGWQLQKKKVPSSLRQDPHQIDFILPRATGGFRIRSNRYFEANLIQSEGKLKVAVNNIYPQVQGEIFLKTYYQPNEVYDSRYEPSFSPTVYPGETIWMELINPDQLSGCVALYALAVDGRLFIQEKTAFIQEQRLEWTIPPSDAIIAEIGLRIWAFERQMRKFFWIQKAGIYPQACYQIDFTRTAMEDWGVDFGNQQRHEVAQCVTHHGTAYTDRQGLHLQGMITFGDADGQLTELTVCFEKEPTAVLTVAFDVGGFMDYKGIRIVENQVEFVKKKKGLTKNLIFTCESAVNGKIALKIDRKHGLIKVVSKEGSQAFFEETIIRGQGGVALMTEGSGSCIIHGCKLETSGFQ